VKFTNDLKLTHWESYAALHIARQCSATQVPFPGLGKGGGRPSTVRAYVVINCRKTTQYLLTISQTVLSVLVPGQRLRSRWAWWACVVDWPCSKGHTTWHRSFCKTNLWCRCRIGVERTEGGRGVFI